ncbi:hypothetical protein D3C71_1504890 [compost metagenome]
MQIDESVHEIRTQTIVRIAEIVGMSRQRVFFLPRAPYLLGHERNHVDGDVSGKSQCKLAQRGACSGKDERAVCAVFFPLAAALDFERNRNADGRAVRSLKLERYASRRLGLCPYGKVIPGAFPDRHRAVSVGIGEAPVADGRSIRNRDIISVRVRIIHAEEFI